MGIGRRLTQKNMDSVRLDDKQLTLDARRTVGIFRRADCVAGINVSLDRERASHLKLSFIPNALSTRERLPINRRVMKPRFLARSRANGW